MADREVSVYLLPSLFEPGVLTGGIAVILDILRASSTITTALSNDAKVIVPFQNVDEALRFRAATPGEGVILGGERGGVKIEGFDLSNSPADYSASRVRNRTIGFTTTNGTNAMLRSKQARHILVGCFLNVSAVIDFIYRHPMPLHLVCAGTNGSITGEDALCPGAIVRGITALESNCRLNDSATLALSYWSESVVSRADSTTSEKVNSGPLADTGWLRINHPHPLSGPTEDAMKLTQGGRNLICLGFSEDIARCSQLNTINRVPRFDPDTTSITLLQR